MAETEIIIRPQTASQAGQGTGTAAESSQAQNPVPAAQAIPPAQAASVAASPAAPVAAQVIVPSEQTAEAVQAPAAQETLLTKAQLLSPEDYVFQFSPETVVDTLLIDEFKRFAFEQNMSLENARLMARFYEKYVLGQSKKQSQEQEELLKSMQKACEEDSEFGGMGFYDNMRYARAAILRFDDGSLAKILNDTGFGSHPEVVRFMYRVGRALAEKEMPRAKESPAERSVAELFYPSMVKE